LIGQISLNVSKTDVRNAIAGNQNSVPSFFKGTAKSSSVLTGESVGAKHRLKGSPTYGFWGKIGGWVLIQVSSSEPAGSNCNLYSYGPQYEGT